VKIEEYSGEAREGELSEGVHVVDDVDADTGKASSPGDQSKLCEDRRMDRSARYAQKL
jgi:hypothetical protein